MEPTRPDDSTQITLTDAAALAEGTPAVTDGGEPVEDRDLDALVARLSDADGGHGDSKRGAQPIFTSNQASALVACDLLDLGRQDAADRLDVSVWSLDDRLHPARAKVAVVAETARVLLDLDLLDLTDLGVESAQTAQDTPSEDAAEETTEDTAEDSDAASGAWGALMALDSVRRVTRANGVSVYLDRPTDEEVEEVRRILTEDLGLVEWGSDSFETATSGTLRGRYPNAEDRAAQDSEEDVDEEAPAPRELAADLPSATRPAQGAVTRVESGPVEETTEDTAEDDDGEESGETFVCEDCGFEADTPGGLGGHRKSCEARRERLDAEEADVSTLTGIGPKKAEALRSNGFETVLDVAHGNPARGMMKSDVLGGKVLVRAWNEARERLGLADVAPGTEE